MMSLFRTPMENKEDKYKTDIRFVRYFLFKIIYLQEDGLSPNDIYNICLNEYGNIISHKSLIEYVENSFMYEKGKFYLSEGQTYNYKNLLIVQHLFYYFQNKGIEKIKYELKIMLNSYSKDINVLLSLVFALNNILNNKPDDYYFMIALDIIVNLNDYYREMDYIINDLPDNIHSKLPDLILSQDIIEILDSVGVKSIETLDVISIESIICIFSFNIKNVIGYFKRLSNFNVYDFLKKTINRCFNVEIKEQRNFEIFCERYGILNKFSTLEEVGFTYGITRERVRQICKKYCDEIEQEFNNNSQDISFCFSVILGLDKIYITKEELIKKIKENVIVNKLCFLCSEYDNFICYEDKYHLFYDSIEHNLDEIISNEIEKIGYAISINDFNELDDLKKCIVLADYRITSLDKNLYLYKKLSYTELVLKIIEKNFPEGYKLGNKIFYIKLNEIFKETYHEPLKMTQRAIGADLIRHDFCYIDRGTVKKRNELPELPEEIFNNIIEYLSDINGVIYYQTIYDEFKDVLTKLGINNRYFLKGLLDQKLPNTFITNRDYINIKRSNCTPFNEIYRYIIGQSSIIYMSDLREKYKGVKDHVFANYISKINDVIWIKYMKEFVLLEDIYISSKTVKIIKDNLIMIFDKLKSNTIVCSKLYSRLKITTPEIFYELKDFNNDFAFCSLISTLFKNEYYFRRPYISIDKNEDLNYMSLITSYVNTLNKFTNNIIKDYTIKMHLRHLYSYLDFQIQMSDKFVQINIDTCYKKEILQINDTLLKDLKRELDYYINSFGFIDTRTYNDYSSLPRFRVGWNKYFLVGLIRSYLNEYYNIEYTDTMFNKTDFIIRRA